MQHGKHWEWQKLAPLISTVWINGLFDYVVVVYLMDGHLFSHSLRVWGYSQRNPKGNYTGYTIQIQANRMMPKRNNVWRACPTHTHTHTHTQTHTGWYEECYLNKYFQWGHCVFVCQIIDISLRLVRLIKDVEKTDMDWSKVH